MNILQRIKSTPNLLLLIIGAGFISPLFAMVSLISSISEIDGGLVVFYLLSSILSMTSSVMLLLKVRFSRLFFLTAFLLSCLPTLFAEYEHGLEGLVAMAFMVLVIMFVLIFYFFKNKQVIRYMTT